MKYLKDEIILLSDLKFKREDVKEALDCILDGYNRIFTLAIHQQEYIKKKNPEYAENMERNFKLQDRNKFLEEEYKRYKNLYKEQINYIKTLEKEIKIYKNLIIAENKNK